MYNIAIVILNWNGIAFLKQFLHLVIKYSDIENTKVIVADNASNDESVKYIQQNHQEVEIIQLDKNYGFAGGYKLALHKVKAKYFVLLNSDIEVTPGWLQPIYELMEADETIAACQPKIRSYHNKEYFEHAGASGGFLDKFGYPFCRGRILDIVEHDHGQYDDNREIFWASGACMMIRSDAYYKAGELDSEFFAHMEEIELCWRLKNLGYKIFVAPKSLVYHIGGGTLPMHNPFKLYLNFRNSLIMLYKNLHTKNRRMIIFMRLILDGLAAIKFLLSFSFKAFLSIPKAHWYYFSYVIRNKKIDNTKFDTKPLPSHIYRKSILIEYFIRKKSRFSDLDNI